LNSSLLQLTNAYCIVEDIRNKMDIESLKTKGLLIQLGKSTAPVDADLKDETGKLLYVHRVSTYMIFKF